MTDDVTERLDRLEAIVEEQGAVIEAQRAELNRQRQRIAELSGDDAATEREGTAADGPGAGHSIGAIDDPDEPDEPVGEGDVPAGESDGSSSGEGDGLVGRRAGLAAGGLLGTGGFATGFAAASSDATDETAANASGQVGTGDQPVRALYTAELNGPVTGDSPVKDVLGDGLTVAGESLTADVGDGLELDAGAVRADAAALAGTGLTPTEPATVGVDLDAIAGDNVTVDTANTELDVPGAQPYTGTSAYLSASQDTTGPTQVEFDQTAFDPGENFDSTNGAYVAPEDGFYAVTFKSYTEADLLSIHVNGATQVDAEPPIASKTVALAAGDSVTAHVDGDGVVRPGEDETYPTVDRLG